MRVTTCQAHPGMPASCNCFAFNISRRAPPPPCKAGVPGNLHGRKQAECGELEATVTREPPACRATADSDSRSLCTGTGRGSLGGTSSQQAPSCHVTRTMSSPSGSRGSAPTASGEPRARHLCLGCATRTGTAAARKGWHPGLAGVQPAPASASPRGSQEAQAAARDLPPPGRAG